MAQQLRFICGDCGRDVTSWSDGNPYYFDDVGQKQYAHHPDHERLARCIGNDSEHICLDCGLMFLMDSRAPVTACTGCHSTQLFSQCLLEGQRCPFCKTGTFHVDPDFFVIS
jgi:DNA-directed RNA polymerase subunit RPC12/RpoP